MPSYPAAPPVTFAPPPRFPARPAVGRPPGLAGGGAPEGRPLFNPPAPAAGEMPRPSAVRGAAPEDPPPPPPSPAPVPIPSPEELGVAPPAAAPPAAPEVPAASPAPPAVDWARTRARL